MTIQMTRSNHDDVAHWIHMIVMTIPIDSTDGIVRWIFRFSKFSEITIIGQIYCKHEFEITNFKVMILALESLELVKWLFKSPDF